MESAWREEEEEEIGEGDRQTSLSFFDSGQAKRMKSKEIKWLHFSSFSGCIITMRRRRKGRGCLPVTCMAHVRKKKRQAVLGGTSGPGPQFGKEMRGVRWAW